MAFKFKNKLLEGMNKFGDKFRNMFKRTGAGVTRGMQDVQCKQSYYGKIDRRVCKNNCKHYDRQEKKCKLGYKI